MNFPPGTRVRYSPRANCIVSICRGLYMHLGAVKSISGVVMETPGHFGETLFFRPDRWPLPPDVFPQGFGVEVSRLANYDGPELHAPLTNGIGQPYTPEQVQALVFEKLKER